MKIYQTDNKELALISLAANNRNTLFYSRNRCVRPIRMQWHMLRELGMEPYHAWKPQEQPAVDRWQAKGGVLRYHPHQHSLTLALPACDALLYMECPFQINRFERDVSSVRQEVVIYRPPTWELHTETLDYLYPPRDTYVMLGAIFESLHGRELPEDQAACLALSGYARGAVFTAWDIEQLTGWSEKYLKCAMALAYKFKYGRFHIYSTRISPDDGDMLWAYDTLRGQASVSRGQYALRFNIPPQGRVPGFEPMLKRLIKQSHVFKEDNIYVVNLDAPPLDLDRIDALNNMHRGRWFKMKSLVDDSPEYDYGQD